MKNIKLLIQLPALLAFLVFSASCEENWLDINQDPLASTEVPSGALMTNAMITLSQNKVQAFDIWGHQFSQQLSSDLIGNWTGPDAYDFESPTPANNAWFSLYVSIQRDVNVGVFQEENAGNLVGVGQLQALSAYAYLLTTDIFGDIPFSQANNPDFPFPEFDAQADVYQGIIDLLTTAIDNMESGEGDGIDAALDPLYFGDVDNWNRFANTLLLRALMRVSDVEDRSADIAALLGKGTGAFISTADQAAIFRYYDSPTQQNFHYKTFNGFRGFGSFLQAGGVDVYQAWFLSGEPLIDLLDGAGDPRIDAYYDLHPSNPGNYVGKQAGGAPVPPVANRSSRSLFYIAPDGPDFWCHGAEYWLLAAEAYQRGLATGDAQTAFETGVRVSMDVFDGSGYEIAEGDKTAFIGTLPSLAGLSAADALTAIQEQQYIANYGNGIEAWSAWKRTKVPDLLVPVGAPIDDVISRIAVAANEVQRNPNAPQNPALLDAPMYYETN